MSTNYDGLTVNKWPGTWSPSGDQPIVLDQEIRGGLRFVSGDVGDRLTNITGQRLQEGMLAYLKNGYTESGVTFESGKYYQYRSLEGESRDPATGVLPNSVANWSEFVSGGGGGPSESINGSAFVTNIEPQNTAETVSEKIFSSDGFVLDSCATTTELVRISVLALPGNTNYKPLLTVNGIPVTQLTAQSDAPLFRGTLDLDLDGSSVVIIQHEDGASHTVLISRDAPPVIETANFLGGYPGTQTELKAGDTFGLFVQSDIPVVAVQLDNYGAYSAQTFPVTSGLSHTVTATIANRGTTTQDLGAKVRVQKSTGAWSEYFLTESLGSTDGVNLVKLNNLFPTISFSTVTYPTNQTALKNNETATVIHSVSNFNTISYTSPNAQLSIANAQAFETEKTVSRLAGDYNINANNFRVTATRVANAAVTVGNTLVRIANTAPTVTITITGSPARLRSGGNDGTAAQSYTVNVVSTQQLRSAPSLTAPAATFLGTGFTGGPTTWSRSLRVTDNDPKGSFNFAGLSAFGLSGIEQTAINSGATYVLGGFVSRQIPLEAFQNEAVMNVSVETYTKVVLSWSFNSNVNLRAALDANPPLFRSWCLVSPIAEKPVRIRILDDSYNASTQQSTITIQETI